MGANRGFLSGNRHDDSLEKAGKVFRRTGFLCCEASNPGCCFELDLRPLVPRRSRLSLVKVGGERREDADAAVFDMPPRVSRTIRGRVVRNSARRCIRKVLRAIISFDSLDHSG